MEGDERAGSYFRGEAVGGLLRLEERFPFVFLDLVDDEDEWRPVVAEIKEDEGEAFFQSQEATNGFASKVGARALVAFHGVTIDIPANEAVPVAVDSVEGDAQTGELIHAHEQTRLALCDALLLSLDTTWHKLIEQVGERQRELAGLYRKADEQPDAQLHAEARAELTRSENARDALREQLGEARMWARHGYEIGQKHCSWSDHGVAPEWLTEGWPPHIDSCEHLKVAAEFDEALTRVRGLPEQPEIMDAKHEQPHGYIHGYRIAIRDAKRAARADRPQAAENGG